jgi:hypothetical protein
VSRRGACPCGTVEFRVVGPVRDVIVCHCSACREAAGGPWGAAAVLRSGFLPKDEGVLRWERAAVSAHGASRAFCRSCRAYVLWDAPGRETVSFSAELLGQDGSDLAVAAHIWVPREEREALAAAGLVVAAAGLPPGVRVAWHEREAPRGSRS